jgi:uncharacterized protein
VKIAVVGSGVAGLGASWALARTHDVTLYEAGATLGGHANTADLWDRGRSLPVDTGFIVYNDRNYPDLVRLFEFLEVPTEASDMSFSVSVDRGAFEYRARLAGLAAQPSNLLRPRYLRMIREIIRFTREAKALGADDAGLSTAAFLERGGYSDAFRDDFLLPMVACIWSSHLEEMLAYPAATMAGFLDNHGLLDLGNRPLWRTVAGGSRAYVRRLASSLPDVRTDTPVLSIDRGRDEVTVRTADGTAARYDHVVLATHADTTLDILGEDASALERRVLRSFRYQRNIAVLHRDPSFMPVRRRAWSSWNYLARGRGLADATRSVSLTYWMNLLQNLDTERPVFVTLNPADEPRDVEASFTYHHPQFDRDAVDAQALLPSIQGMQRTWFAGSYCGFGFHEDGLRSGLDVAAALGAPAPWRRRSADAGVDPHGALEGSHA